MTGKKASKSWKHADDVFLYLWVNKKAAVHHLLLSFPRRRESQSLEFLRSRPRFKRGQVRDDRESF